MLLSAIIILMKKQETIKIILKVLLVLILIGAEFYFYTFRNEVEVSNYDHRTYTNATYGYTLQYPKDWFVSEETRTLDDVNKIYSSVSFSPEKDGRDITIVVNGKEWLLKYETEETKKIKINSAEQTVYIFSNGYECAFDGPATCPFYVIPIKNGDLWYELHAKGNIKTDDNIKLKILSTFQFID